MVVKNLIAAKKLVAIKRRIARCGTHVKGYVAEADVVKLYAWRDAIQKACKNNGRDFQKTWRKVVADITAPIHDLNIN